MNKKIFIALLIILVVAVLGFWLLGSPQPEQNEQEIIDITTWQTYENEEYAFSVLYPPSWQIAEIDDADNGTRITLYSPDLEGAEPPPFSPAANTTHVTIYPLGASTEALFGQFDGSNAQSSLPMKRKIDYVLRDASRFATYAAPETSPESWSEDGFILARVYVQDQTITCVGGGEQGSEKLESECDINTDEMIRSGTIDQHSRDIVKLILNNFHFTQ